MRLTLILPLALLALTACNTTAGVGRDLKSVGNAIERAAN
jgi:predicted small secreted protein